MSAVLDSPSGLQSSNVTPLSGNALALLTTRLAKLKLEELASALRKDRTVACKMRTGERDWSLAEICAALAPCGLKIVDKDKICVDRRAYESMTYLASKALANQKTAETLIWDEEQG